LDFLELPQETFQSIRLGNGTEAYYESVCFVPPALEVDYYNVGDKLLEGKIESMSEYAATKVTQNYIVNVFDFKKRYNIND
jgi:hypothetical protein